MYGTNMVAQQNLQTSDASTTTHHYPVNLGFEQILDSVVSARPGKTAAIFRKWQLLQRVLLPPCGTFPPESRIQHL